MTQDFVDIPDGPDAFRRVKADSEEGAAFLRRLAKPRASVGEIAARRTQCQEKKAAGLPCEDPLFKPSPTISWRKRPCRWIYAVTTVPERVETYLPPTLASLAAGGFDDPWLFVDGTGDPQSIANRFSMNHDRVVGRRPRIGPFGHWLLTLAELVIRGIRGGPHPQWKEGAEPDLIAIFQDDLVTCRNLRTYLERCRLPERGYWNLLTFPENQAIAPPDGGWFLSNQRGFGAVALIFTLEAAKAILSQRVQVWDKFHASSTGNRKIDGGVVEAMHHAGYREFVHSPSLVFHTGAVSSLGNPPHPDAPAFIGETADAAALPVR